MRTGMGKKDEDGEAESSSDSDEGYGDEDDVNEDKKAPVQEKKQGKYLRVFLT
jgi:hypothetical protein